MNSKQRWIAKKRKQDPKYFSNKMKEYRRLNKDRCRNTELRWRHTKEGYITRLATVIKSRHPESNITRKWIANIINKGVCQLTGLPFDYEDIGTRLRPCVPSIDRINNKKGYTKRNCRIILCWLNIAKQDLPAKIFLDLIQKAVYNIKIKGVTNG